MTVESKLINKFGPWTSAVGAGTREFQHRAVHTEAPIKRGDNANIARIRYGGEGNRTRILCGFLGTHNAHDPLLASLPSLITIKLDASMTGQWVEESMRFAMRELVVGGPSAIGNLNRLAELLLAEAVREYVAQLPADQRGWLAGLRDPVVGNALPLIHGQLSRRWTLDDLTREVATSRTVLGERFTRFLDVPPIKYHRRRQLGRAADWLSHSNRPVASIAFDVGYNSVAAFSRSFKRVYGSSPGAFREATRNQRQSCFAIHHIPSPVWDLNTHLNQSRWTQKLP